MWSGFFECLEPKNVLGAKNSLKNWIPGEVFSLYFLLQDLPPTVMPFWLIPQKVPKLQVIWDLGRGNPANLGRRNRTCHVMAPPVLTWRTQLFIKVPCVWGGGGRGPLTWQPLAQNLNVSFNKSKKVNVFLHIISNLAGNINSIETYHVNRDYVEGPSTARVGGRGEGVRRLMWYKLPGSMWTEAVTGHGKKRPLLLGLIGLILLLFKIQITDITFEAQTVNAVKCNIF